MDKNVTERPLAEVHEVLSERGYERVMSRALIAAEVYSWNDGENTPTMRDRLIEAERVAREAFEHLGRRPCERLTKKCVRDVYETLRRYL